MIINTPPYAEKQLIKTLRQALTVYLGRMDKNTPRRLMAWWLIFNVAGLTVKPVWAAGNNLPNPCATGVCGTGFTGGFVTAGAASYSINGTTGTITQTSNTAITNWENFDVGAGYKVQLNQLSSASRMLARVWDGNPSTIAGTISANGQLFLINHNGIIFSNGAQVNASSLVASALNISDSIFKDPAGIYSNPDGTSTIFNLESGFENSLIRVDSGANIASNSGGYVMILAPKVTNNGNISSKNGQVMLAAGDKVYIAVPPSSVASNSAMAGLSGVLIEVDSSTLGANGGIVTNDTLGNIIAERGNVTLAALSVNQKGRVTATTSVNNKGSIRLLARESTATDLSAPSYFPTHRKGLLTIGADSVTQVGLETADTSTTPANQTFNRSTIELVGSNIDIEDRASLIAHSGQITLLADARIYLGHGSLLDTSGLQNVAMAMSSNFVDVQLFSSQLADAPLLRNGPLARQTVTVDVRKGTTLVNAQSYIDARQQTLAERSAKAGDISMFTQGEIISQSDSKLNISGGSLVYAAGEDLSSQLTSNGKIYDISVATADRVYDGIANTYSKSSLKWGTSETFNLGQSAKQLAGYVEGKNAGTVTMAATTLALDGNITGNVTVGDNQKTATTAPIGGLLTLGAIVDTTLFPTVTPSTLTINPFALVISSSTADLPSNFDFNTSLSSNVTHLKTSIFDHVSRIAMTTDTTAVLDTNSNVHIANGGSFVLQANNLNNVANALDIKSDIVVPSGKIKLTANDTSVNAAVPSTNQVNMTIHDGVTLSTKGMWLNDLLDNGTSKTPAFINGGDIQLTSTGLSIGHGSVLDVSGGGWLKSNRTLVKGTGGNITASSLLDMNGVIHGDALGLGGSLSLTAASVTIGGTASGHVGELHLTDAFFNQGFTSYTVNGIQSLVVADGTKIHPTSSSVVLEESYRFQPTGSVLTNFSKIETLPVYTRNAASLSLGSGNIATAGSSGLTIGNNALIEVDPKSSITLNAWDQLTVNGQLTALGGSINLNMLANLDSTDDSGFRSNQSIWLGAQSVLLASGTALLKPIVASERVQGEVTAGGSINITATKGYVVSEQGATMDVSGTSGGVGIVNPTGGYTIVPLNTNAGSINIKSREGAILAGTMQAQAGGQGASGGSLSVNVTTDAKSRSIANAYPTSERIAKIQADVVTLPNGLQAGQVIDGVNNGIATISTQTINQGGFAALKIEGEDVVQFSGDQHLALNQSVKINAPRLEVTGNVTLDTAYMEIGNQSTSVLKQAAQSTVAGTGVLNVNTKMLDFTGNITANNLQKAVFNATGDIRFNSISLIGKDANNNDVSKYLAGSFNSAGNLDFIAAQLYPSSLSDYSVNVKDASGTATGLIRVLPSGQEAALPLSALGKLTFSAADIEQNGVVRAPMGSLAFNATNDLTLGSGSETSITANGLTIPLGRTLLSGQNYVYNLGTGNLAISALPDKTIKLNAKNVETQANAVVDLRGGGDLAAYEFIAGVGGSKDVLDPANTVGSYAVLPSYTNAYAPYDAQESAGLASQGQRVHLTAADGLPEGDYVLLPARYALLPGAFLVTKVSGKTDFSSNQTYRMADGSSVVSGYYNSVNADGTVVRDARTSAFKVSSGSIVRTQSEYLETNASKFFAGSGNQTDDAGRLSITAQTGLTLDATLKTAAAQNARGAAVDISADKIALVNSLANSLVGYVNIETDKLNHLNAETLFVGGSRTTTAAGEDLTVAATEVVLQNDAAHGLKAPEVILAATSQLSLAAGSVVENSGTAKPNATTKQLTTNGDGALLRVANTKADLARSNVTRSQGNLDIAAGAKVTGFDVTLDATQNNRSAGEIVVTDQGRLSLSSNRISIGETAGVNQGFILSNNDLNAFNNLSNLKLVSYSTIDLYGAVDFGNQNLALNLDAGSIAGYDNHSKTANITAKELTLSNTNASVYSAASARDDASIPQLGDGSLNLSASKILVAGNQKRLDGFATNQLGANEVVVSGASGSKLDVAGDLVMQTARLTANSGASQTIAASGAVDIVQSINLTTLAAASPSLGANLTISGTQVTNASLIKMQGGNVNLKATAGDVTIAHGGEVNTSGVTKSFGVGGNAAIAAGKVNLTSSGGDVVVADGAKVNVSGVTDGDAGTFTVKAADGQFVWVGDVAADTSLSANTVSVKTGKFDLDVNAVSDFTMLNRQLNEAGFNESRVIRARTGGIDIAATEVGVNAVKAHTVNLSADAGQITVAGEINADGKKGGEIQLAADQSLTLLGSANLHANATDASSDGGYMQLATNGSNGGTLDIQTGANVKVIGGVQGAGGEIRLRAPRTGANGGDEVAVTALDGTFTGQRSLTLEAYEVYQPSAGDLTISSGANSSTVLNVATTAGAANGTLFTDANNFITHKASILSRLNKTTETTFHLTPGMEVRSLGDITVSVNETSATKNARGWDLNTWRFDNEPGVLTLRANGDIKVNGTISDGFVKASGKAASDWVADATHDNFWSYRFVSGADLFAANPLSLLDAPAANKGNFSLNVARSGTTSDPASAIIRTGDGRIDFASAGDFKIQNKAAVIYTAGVSKLSQSVANFVAPSVSGVTATYAKFGGDINIHSLGNIIGTASDQLITDWLYRQGQLDANGNLITASLASQNTKQPTWWVATSQFKQGVGALGGGDINVDSAGNIENLSVVIPTNGRLGGVNGSTPSAANLVIQGGGDLNVVAAGDILSGIFYVEKGAGNISAGGQLGQEANSSTQNIFALGDSTLKVSSVGDLNVRNVFNPFLFSQAASNLAGSGANRKSFFTTYGENSLVDFTSLSGNVNLLNTVNLPSDDSLTNNLLTYYPSVTSVKAVSGDIVLSNGFTLAPAAKGQLDLLANGNVSKIVGDVGDNNSPIQMLDLASSSIPTALSASSGGLVLDGSFTGSKFHDPDILHLTDSLSSHIVALNGSISSSSADTNDFAVLAESLIMSAGLDIRNVALHIQNVHDTDVSLVHAGRDVVFDAPRDANGNVKTSGNQIVISGPGRLQVDAGRNVDLGASFGILSNGNTDNPYLLASAASTPNITPSGASIYVQAGSTLPADYVGFVNQYVATAGTTTSKRNYLPQLTAFMRTYSGNNSLTDAQAITEFATIPSEKQAAFVNPIFFTELKIAGKQAADVNDKQYKNYDIGSKLITSLFPTDRTYKGDLNLFFSQIKTLQGGDIEMLVPGGLVNAGLASASGLSKSTNELGIVTVGGGSVQGVVRDDFLVNQSRVFTLAGGDIVLWSEDGNIDAGKGAKTVSATPPPVLRINTSGVLALDVSQSVSGSGIGILKTNPDIDYSKFSVVLVAPKGEVNAGDAGIQSAGDLSIAAVRVIGSDNIKVSGASAGVPVADTGAVGGSLGALGTNDNASKLAGDTAKAISDQAKQADAFKQTFKPTFLNIEVLGLGL